MLLALAIFVVTYALIAVGGSRKFRIGRAGAALLGAAAMVIFGTVSPYNAFDSIDFGILFLLIGMMAIVVGLEYCGLFGIISDGLFYRFPPGPKLLAAVMAITAVLAAVALNDAVVLLLAPIVIKFCTDMKTDPVPYLIGTMVSANIGSVATAIGNPQNAYILSASGVSFVDFMLYELPVALACLPAAYLIIFLTFRKRLDCSLENWTCRTEHFVPDRKRLAVMLAIAVVTFVSFAFCSVFGIGIWVPAVIGGSAAVAIILQKEPKRAVWTAKRINWSIILFFIGLFVLMGGVEVSGILEALSDSLPGFRAGETPSYGGLALFSVVLSNLISNVPAAMLIGGMMPDTDAMWYVLAASTTLAGNTTLIGSACNIIVAEKAESEGISIDFWKFLAIGIPITVVTILIQLGIHGILL